MRCAWITSLVWLRTSICPIHQVLHEREALWWWIKWFRGPWSYNAYFAFVFSCPRLLYDSECPLFLMVWLPSIPPKGIQDKIGKPRFGLSLISQAGRFFFLTLIGSYQESRSLQLVTIGGLILQQQKWLVNLWFDRLVISESDSVLDDGILLFSVQYLTR